MSRILIVEDELDLANIIKDYLEAIERTSKKRESQEIMKDYKEIIEDIKDDSYLRSLWVVYLGENKYIGDLTFDKVVGVVTILSNRINEM